MSRLRTFIAVHLTKAIRDKLVAAQEELARATTAAKWVEPENLHVTLVFLGEVDEREIPDVCRLASDAVAEQAPFTLSVEQLGAFPNPRRPRTIWAGIAAGAQELVAIHDDLELQFADLGYRREERRYTPHITLGRMKTEGPADRLAAAIVRHAAWKAGAMAVTEICIMSSELQRDGPLYTVLGRAPLGG